MQSLLVSIATRSRWCLPLRGLETVSLEEMRVMDRLAGAGWHGRHAESKATAPTRISSIDILRGLVMIVMALDHCREYFHAAAALDPTDPIRSNLVLFATRWITYFCAPTFVFLSGLSAYLRGRGSPNRSTLAWFLASRGLWLVILEQTLVAIGFTFHPGYLLFQVIWVIGAGFLILACLVRLPAIIVFIAGVAIIAGHNLLDYVHVFAIAQQADPLDFVDGRLSFVTLGPFHGVLLYSALGWVGILLTGYGAGPIFAMEAKTRRRLLRGSGAIMIALFVGLRLFNHYGDPFQWSPQPLPAQTAMAFLRLSKYPPSLDFTLATLGPMLLLLASLERLQAGWTRVVRTYGRVPLFYYVLHIYLIHGSALLLGLSQGHDFQEFTDPLKPPHDFGVSLASVYLLWAAFVAFLYFPCRWFERLRERRSDWWLSYL